MRNNRNKLFLLSIASLPLFGGDLFGVTGTPLMPSPQAVITKATVTKKDAGMRLGPSETYKSIGKYCIPVTQVQEDTPVSHTMCQAIRLPASLLNKYVGCKIDSIEVVLGARTGNGLAADDEAVEGVKRGNGLTAFVCKDLDKVIKGDVLTSVSTQDYASGYNKFKFNNSVTIEKDQDLYLGYYITLTPGENLDAVAFDDPIVMGYSGEKGNSFFALDFYWQSNSSFPTAVNGQPYYMNAAIRGIASGDKFPDGDVGLISLSSGNDYYVECNSPATYQAKIRNYSPETVKSMEFSVSVNGKESDNVVLNDLNVPSHEITTIDVPGVKINQEGNLDVKLTVKKVNGVDDSDFADNEMTSSSFAYREGGQILRRNVLLEQFTSEGYSEAEFVDESYKEFLADQSNVIWVKHHVKTKGGFVDQFVTDFEKKYVSLYGGASTFFPAACFDRMKFLGMQNPGPAYFVESNVAFEAMLGNVNLIPSFAELNVRPKHNEADNTITVKVNLNTQANVMPGQTDLRLTTWLVEDGIVSTEQKGVSGEYIQDGVIRAVLSEDVWGDKVDISSYSASKEYSIAVDPKWNLANMRVVSFLSNYDPSNKVYQLYNSRESKVQVSSGISSVVRTPDSMVTVTDGNVEAINGNTLVGVHDLSGRSFTGKNLPKGMYIVTVSDGKQQSAVKVVVK
ncbi:MAG: Omp28-related outer membrane protein [Prevotella pectinovora]|uniref:Omp28-related outer membrane protein n=1 Tax=Prevotella pectinovora TaxID=1602169 RepID=UPI002E773F83|nr:Omp28-related outer membrane protein [Prevotella pectinovora]MEE1546434.1 Omp28-related outer membrane protein [Prevotella pectinovora]